MSDSLPTRVRRGLSTLRSLVDPEQVGYLIFYVTNRCNFRCAHCFYHAEIAKGRKSDELRLDEIERIARGLGPLVQLSLTGGEPFVREDFAAVTRTFLEHCAPRFVTIPTNAWFSDRIEAYLEDVLPAFPSTAFRVVFSIDGIGADHDTFRSAPGSWERLCATYARVDALRRRATNLVLDANAAYTARNEHTILSTLETLDRDFSFDNLSVTYIRGNPRDPDLRTSSRDAYLRVVEFLKARSRRREKRFLSPLWRAVDDVTYEHLTRVVFEDEFVSPCVAGRKLVIVGETGDVHPCEILGVSAGNVRDHDYSVPAVLASAAHRRIVETIRETRCKCSFECAIAANAVWSPESYPRVARLALSELRATSSTSVTERKT